MSVAPKVSADESFLMSALRFASSLAPRARDTVTTAGKPSGTAETASAIEISKAFIISLISLVPRTKSSYNSSKKMMTHITTIIIPSFLANFVSFCLRGVSTFSTD